MTITLDSSTMIFALGFLAGGLVFNIYFKFKVWQAHRQVEGFMEKIEARLKEKTIEAKVEEVNSMLYVNKIEDNEFVCQGATVKELKESFDARYPGKRLVINEGDRQLLERLETELKQL